MFDTHCHIHSEDYPLDAETELTRARDAGVEQIVCVGTSAEDSQLAANFAAAHNTLAAAAQHPHEAKHFGKHEQQTITKLAEDGSVQAIGECGLDYYYEHSSPQDQQAALRWHLALADTYALPLLFHIREAFDDFWGVYDERPAAYGGVVHSFTAGVTELEQVVERGLYVAFNGIMSFTNQDSQLAAVKAAPLDKILLETDAPFLTPTPYRGKVNTPSRIREVAVAVAKIRQCSLDEIITATTENARRLFENG